MNTEETVVKRGKTNGYKSNVIRRKRNQRYQEAMKRQETWEGLTTKEKIAKAKSQPGKNDKLLNHLTNRLAEEKANKQIK